MKCYNYERDKHNMRENLIKYKALLYVTFSLFFSFFNILMPKYFMTEIDFMRFRQLFNISNLIGPLSILGIDLNAKNISLKNINQLSLYYVIFGLILVITATLVSFTNIIYSIGILGVGSTQLYAAIKLKENKEDAFYFTSQLYIKLIPILGLGLYLFGRVNIQNIFIVSVVFMTIPLILTIKNNIKKITYMNKTHLSAVSSSVVILSASMVMELVIRSPYLLALSGDDVLLINQIDILTAFLTISLFPFSIMGRKIEIEHPSSLIDYYDNISEKYKSINLYNLIIFISGLIAIFVLVDISLIKITSYEFFVHDISGMIAIIYSFTVLPNAVKTYFVYGVLKKIDIWVFILLILVYLSLKSFFNILSLIVYASV